MLKFYYRCIYEAAKKTCSFANDWQWLFGIPFFIWAFTFISQRWLNDGQSISFPDTNTPLGSLGVALGAFCITWLVGFLYRLIKAPFILYLR
ncbi:MAG: hypothetical protein ACK5O1_04180 [Holosporales bacterium]